MRSHRHRDRTHVRRGCCCGSRPGARSSPGPAAADAALGTNFARRSIATDQRTRRRGNAALDASGDPNCAADSGAAAVQLQLLHHDVGHTMVGHRDRVELFRGTLGRFRRLFQLYNKRAAVTVHPAGTISRAQQLQHRSVHIQHNIQHIVRRRGTARHDNVEFTGQCA
jgi:hypothetical protein